MKRSIAVLQAERRNALAQAEAQRQARAAAEQSARSWERLAAELRNLLEEMTVEAT